MDFVFLAPISELALTDKNTVFLVTKCSRDVNAIIICVKRRLCFYMCLFVCVSVCLLDYSKSYNWIFKEEIFKGGGK